MAKRRGLITYRSYNFKDKDPCIDVLRTARDDAKISFEKIHAAGGPTPSTLGKWFHGETISPRFVTLMAAVNAIGPMARRDLAAFVASGGAIRKVALKKTGS